MTRKKKHNRRPRKHKFFKARIDLKTYHPADPDFPQRRVTFAVDERGNPLGEQHHRAILSDADVELIRDIYDEGMVGYGLLAQVFGVSRATIRDIVTFRRRATTPAEYRTAPASERRPPPKSRLEQLGIDPSVLDRDFDD